MWHRPPGCGNQNQLAQTSGLWKSESIGTDLRAVGGGMIHVSEIRATIHVSEIRTTFEINDGEHSCVDVVIYR